MENAGNRGKSADVLCHQLGLVEIDSLFVLAGFFVPLFKEVRASMAGLCRYKNTFAFWAKVLIYINSNKDINIIYGLSCIL